jgi:O-antigen ligase
VYDRVIVGLLLPASVVGFFLFGAVRLWSIGPLMFLVYAGVLLFCLRPVLSVELRQLQVPPGGILWIVFILYGACMAPSAAVPYDARIELLKLGSFAGAYWAWTELASRQGRWRILLGLLLFAVSLIAWYAIIQHSHGSRLVLNLERPETYGMRASGTYFCPNHFANLLSLLVPLAAALLVTGSAGVPLRLLSGYTLLLFLPVLFLTQSRSGWIGAVVGLSATVCLIARRKSRRLFYLMLVVIPAVFAVAAWLLWNFSPTVRARVTGASPSAPDSAVQARFLMWKDTVPMIREKPVFGHGPGSFLWVYPRFKSHDMQLLFNYAHNEYLHVLAEYGAVGFALFAAFLLWALSQFTRWSQAASRDKDAHLAAALVGSVLGGMAHACFDFNFHIFSNNHALVLMAGVAAAGLYSSGDLKARAIPAPRAFVVWGGGALVALGLVLGVLQVFLSYGLHFLGDADRVRLRTDRAVQRFRWATRIDPGNWRPWLGWGHLLQTRAFWNLDPEARKQQAREAIRLYEAAIERNHCDMEPVFGLSKVLNTVGESEKALELLRGAADYNRQHLFYMSQVGLQLKRMGRDAEALAAFEEAHRVGNADEMVQINIRMLRARLAAQAAASATNSVP